MVERIGRNFILELGDITGLGPQRRLSRMPKLAARAAATAASFFFASGTMASVLGLLAAPVCR